MQLKLKRSQRDGGMISTTVIFCLDARAEFTAEELHNLKRYKLHNTVIYNSEASRKHLERADQHADGSTRGALKGLASLAMAAMKLNISVSSIQKGQHIECKSMEELLGAENALMEACETLKQYLETAATFDGREIVVDFSTDQPQVVAETIPVAQQLIAPSPDLPPLPPLAKPAPAAIEYREQPDGEWQATPEPQAYEEPSGYAYQQGVSEKVMDYVTDPDNRKGLAIGGAVMLAFLMVISCS